MDSIILYQLLVNFLLILCSFQVISLKLVPNLDLDFLNYPWKDSLGINPMNPIFNQSSDQSSTKALFPYQQGLFGFDWRQYLYIYCFHSIIYSVNLRSWTRIDYYYHPWLVSDTCFYIYSLMIAVWNYC